MPDDAAISGKTVRGKPFKKGQSGNPNGRPKLPKEVREIAKAGSVRAIERAVELIEATDPNIALKAINTVLDRGYGKPAQSHEVSGPGGGPLQTLDLTNATDEQLAALSALIAPLAAAAAGSDEADQGGTDEAGD